MSQHYFYDMKCSVAAWLRSSETRVVTEDRRRAKQGLSDTRWSILEVVLNAGFQNSSHFARTFRKICGGKPVTFSKPEKHLALLFLG